MLTLKYVHLISIDFKMENGLPGYCRAIPYVLICNKYYSKKQILVGTNLF